MITHGPAHRRTDRQTLGPTFFEPALQRRIAKDLHGLDGTGRTTRDRYYRFWFRIIMWRPTAIGLRCFIVSALGFNLAVLLGYVPWVVC
jgi:hypothetical protein